MFERIIDTKLKMRMLRKDDAEELFRVIDGNREFLREWLPWLDGNTEVEQKIGTA